MTSDAAEINLLRRRVESCNTDRQEDKRQLAELRAAVVQARIVSTYVSVADPWGGAIARPPLLHKRDRKIFLNASENKSSYRKLSLIPFVSSAYYVE